jgi:hypothetical protein
VIEVAIWLVSVSAVFGLAYSLGFQAGRLVGKREGFQMALVRADEAQRPLNVLYRALVPRRAA